MTCSSGISIWMRENDASAGARVRGERRETHGVGDVAKGGKGLAEGILLSVPRQVSRERKDQLGDARRSWCRRIRICVPDVKFAHFD
jgi:hypothetical protein